MLQWAPECFGTPGDLKLAALAISEPEGGSDVRNLRTRARRDGEDWIIDGHKMWIGNGGIANVHVVNAVVDEELGHRGQALFVVPGGTPAWSWCASWTSWAAAHPTPPSCVSTASAFRGRISWRTREAGAQTCQGA